MFAYVSNRIPEISDELYKIDDAMKAGFGWENGPFEIWDAIGLKRIEIKKAEVRASCLGNRNASCWKQKLLYCYRWCNSFYNIPSKAQTKIPGKMILLS
jgi:3-hydroxyacyl-CoA dehydrogenase